MYALRSPIDPSTTDAFHNVDQPKPTRPKMKIEQPEYFKQHGIANKLQKRSLLIAVNLVAGLSIFFFGYDQGVMGGGRLRCLLV